MIEKRKAYAPDYERWRKTFNKMNWIIVLSTLALEIGMYFLLDQSNMIDMEKSKYIWGYLVQPSLNNIIVALAGQLCTGFCKSTTFKNGAPVIALTCLFINIANVHAFFKVTMATLLFPVFVTAFFGSILLLRIVTGLCLVAIVEIYVRFSILDPMDWADGTYLPTVFISITVILVGSAMAEQLIKILKNKNDTLIEFADEADRAAKDAIHANLAKSEFLSMVSHEIRTPMNAIVGMTEVMLRDPLTDMQRKYLNNIRISGNSLVMIVNDILDQSKIEAGKMELVDKEYSLRETTEDIRMIIENRIGEKPVALIYNIEDSIPDRLIGDPLRIRQVLINLMNNAVKFTEKGSITLGICKAEETEGKISLRIGIRDTGAGIQQEDMGKLFDAFSQVDAKKNYGKEGTGLGLRISAGFVELMGGKLEVTSEYGVGTEFYFTIPQGVSENQQTEVEDEMEEFTAPEAKILVVDDTPLNLMVCESLFGTMGIIPDTATSGKRALERVKEKAYDIVFLDYLMPDMDGFETAGNLLILKNEELTSLKDTQIVLLSSDVSKETRMKFAELGIQHFVEKPIRLEALKAMLKELL